MQEQADLSWDGVIYPIQTLSWEGVVETAKRFDGLMVDENFHVTYKDEESEVIHVKNERDLNEALVWARERRLHLLLEIPFPSLHDSDDDWSLAGDSPKHRPREPDNSTLLEADQLMNFSLQADKTILDLERKTEEEAEIRIRQEEEELRLRNEAEELSRLKREEEELRLRSEAEELSRLKQEEELRLRREAEELSRLKREEEELRLRQEEEELRLRQEEEERRLRQEEEERRLRQEVEERRLRQEEEERRLRQEEEESRLRQEEIRFKREEEELRLREETRQKEVKEKLNGLEKLRLEVEEMQLRFRREAEERQLQLEMRCVKAKQQNEILDEDKETIRLLEALRVDQTQQSSSQIDDFIKKVTEIDCSEFDEAAFRKFLSQYFSDSNHVQTTIAFMRTPAFQSGFLGAVQSLDTNSLFKASQTQVLKHAEELVKWFQDIPFAQGLVLDLLRYLKNRSGKNNVLHPQVMCDGCTSSPENSAASLASGFRSATGDILGVRYKSAITQDYDLCEYCEASGKFQDKGPYLKIVDPANAPESILVILPGTNQTLAGQLQSLDWRNPLAAEFKEFVEQKRQKSFSRASTPQSSVKTDPPTVGPVSMEVSQNGVSIHAQRCKHLLKTFTTPHAGFGCDICNTKVPINTVMNGCRICNWDACNSCLASPNTPSTPLSIPPSPPQAKFVSDVTLADGSVVRPGEVVTKTWRIRNTGQDYWPAHTRIAHVGGDAFGGPLEGVEVPCAAPGEAVNVGVNLKMPQQPGRYTSYWRLMTPSPQNAKFGHRFWVTVNVVPPQPERALPSRLPHVATPTLIGSPVRPVEPTPSLQVEQSIKPVPPKPSTHDLAVAQLVDMGFTNIDQVVQVLKDVDGDVERAIVQLMT